MLRLEATVLEDPLQAQRQGPAVEGLEQVVGGPELHGVDGGLHVDHAGHHDDLLLGVALLDAVDELAAVHARHHQVGEHDVEVGVLQDVEGFLAARGGLGLEALLREHPREQLAEVALVVDRQDPRFGHRNRFPVAACPPGPPRPAGAGVLGSNS